MGLSSGRHIASNNKAYKTITQKQPGYKPSNYKITLPEEIDELQEKVYQQPGTYKPWEDEVVKRFYKVKDTASICIILVRSQASVLNRIAYLKIKNKLSPDYSIKIPELIERQVSSIPDRKYRMFKPWEDEVLKLFFLQKSRNHIAKVLGKAANSLTTRHNRLKCLNNLKPDPKVKIPKNILDQIDSLPCRNFSHYSPVEREIVLRYYKVYGPRQLKSVLERSVYSIRSYHRDAVCLDHKPNYDIVIPKDIMNKLKTFKRKR